MNNLEADECAPVVEFKDRDYSKITLAEIEEKVNKCFEKQLEYKQADRIAKDLYHELGNLEAEVIAILEQHERNDFKTDKGHFSYTYREAWRTPKTNEEKQAFAEYIKKKYGEEFFWATFGVNSRSLGSFCNQELAEEEKKGNLTFQIPGIERETSTATASLRPSGGDKGKAHKAALAKKS